MPIYIYIYRQTNTFTPPHLEAPRELPRGRLLLYQWQKGHSAYMCASLGEISIRKIPWLCSGNSYHLGSNWAHHQLRSRHASLQALQCLRAPRRTARIISRWITSLAVAEKPQRKYVCIPGWNIDLKSSMTLLRQLVSPGVPPHQLGPPPTKKYASFIQIYFPS